MAPLRTNTLYYGDNLQILRDYIPDESVDLIYLDPPFNSNRSYNVLFKENTSAASAAQTGAFEDTWHWGDATVQAYEQIALRGGDDTARLLKAMVDALGHNDVTAYLSMMAIRLVGLRRVLKPTGSIYLHCDPTASHYLKVLMDGIFGPKCFRTEIIWKRSTAHSDTKQGRHQHGRIHDTLLFYTRTEDWTWIPTHTTYDEDYVDSFYKNVEPETGRRYGLDNLTGPGGAAKGNPEYEVLGVTRYWRYTRQKMEALIAEGKVVQTRPDARPEIQALPG